MRKNNQLFIGRSLLKKMSKFINVRDYSKIGILTDENIAKYWLSILKKGIDKQIIPIIIPPGEKMKTITQTIEIWKKMMEAGFDRHSLLINLGGGVISDMGGFAASTYMRGIDFVNIPTSLLAMVDASIGGKTGINFNRIKNIIGTFNQPVKIIIDTHVLKTLSIRQLKAAFAEIIKHGIISNPKYFDFATSKKPEEFSNIELLEIIKDSIRIKKGIVDEDPKETGLRKSLNFGHTIGHAIEALSLETQNPLLHGETIAIGMIAESKLAELSKLLSSNDFLKIELAIKNSGLPTKIKNISMKDILKKIQSDKKNRSGKILWTLPKKIGRVDINIETSNGNINKSITYILS